MSEEIKPCPFCGCKAEWMSHQFQEIDFGGYQIACTNPSCQATCRYSSQRQKAKGKRQKAKGKRLLQPGTTGMEKSHDIPNQKVAIAALFIAGVHLQPN